MVSLASLWLPILLSAVAVFLVSSVIHMASPWHASDYPRVPDEGRLRAALGPLSIPPGDYMVPRVSSRQELRDPAFLEKVAQGPNLILTVLPTGQMSMGRNLAMWFAYALVISLFAGYVASRALAGPGEQTSMEVFRFAGTAAFLGYSVALWQMSIWYRRSWSTTTKATIDGLIYALVTAGVFVWLWPR